MALIEHLCGQLAAGEPVSVVGGNTKAFLGGRLVDEPVAMTEYAGILSYEPTELVLSAKAGTSVSEIQQVLDEAGQMLPFEPPVFGETSTLGGIMASGLSGPRRMHLGSCRDAILGVRLINGLGQHLKFGGEVMKNVAGYDLSRLSVGALGTLGVLTEISVKVLPRPEKETTVVCEVNQADALALLSTLGRKPYPISAASWIDGQLYLRISGAGRGVDAAAEAIGGAFVEDAKSLWQSIRDLTHPVFQSADRWLWRLSVPPNTPVDGLPSVAFDWAGGQRWVFAEPDRIDVFEMAARVGGHATCYAKNRHVGSGMQPLESGVLRLNQRVKEAMDPHGLLNRGRLLEEAH